MTIVAGTRLGRFEIVDLLGAGGMGEVYRALDTRLGRQIALKVLPQAVADDAQQIARLQREARVLASLTHPNIAALYDLEHAGERWFLVMELAEGATLAEIVHGSRLPAHPSPGLGPPSQRERAEVRCKGLAIDEVLRIAVQIADALDAAHLAGIVHRDLKPANIKVAPHGQVKVLDFGIARTLATAVDDTSRTTQPGQAPISADFSSSTTIMGTPSYMSPEQIRGLPVDKRTDIWAFGCCLYETLTGQRAFAAPTISDTIAALLNTEPDWEKLPTETPAPIRKLLRHCLAKDTRRRLRDIGDARLELEDLLGRADDHRQAEPAARPADFKAVLASRLVNLALLSERLGVAAGARLVARHDTTFRDCLMRSGGVELDRGADGFVATFELPSDAVVCALLVQERVSSLDAPEPLKIAIGIHAGEVGRHHGGLLADPAVDTAMRVARLAQPGQVLLTDAADSARLDLARTPEGTPIVWLDHGAYMFPGIETPLEVTEAGIIGLSTLSRPPDTDTVKRAPTAWLRMPPIYQPRKK